jgi:hypothetical protein
MAQRVPIALMSAYGYKQTLVVTSANDPKRTLGHALNRGYFGEENCNWAFRRLAPEVA